MKDELNLEGWGDFGGMMVETWDALQQDNGVPILDEYCWTHTQQPGGGGWTCPYCYQEQKNVSDANLSV
jgi:hypothetical protein